MRAELQPIGELENPLVDRITAAIWRLSRLVGWRPASLLGSITKSSPSGPSGKPGCTRMNEASYDDFFGPEVRITDEEKHEEAMSRAGRTRGEQEDETATLGRMFARNADGANAFSKLSRYETAIEQRLYKALHELERRQTTRQGGAVPEPTSWMSTPRMSQRGIGEFGFVS